MNKNYSFLLDNTQKVNKTVLKISFSVLFLPLALYGGNLGHVWELPVSYLLLLQALLVASYCINLLIYKKVRNPEFLKYISVISITAIIGFVSANGRVGIYISYGFFPFLASLYYSKRYTTFISIVSWLSMMISLYVRTRLVYMCDPIDAEIYTPDLFFARFSIGFSIEMAFTYFLAMLMTAQGQRTLFTLVENIDTQNNMYITLAEKNSELEETQNKIIQFISKILGSHDLFTGNHVVHTRTYIGIIVRELQNKGLYPAELTRENMLMMESAALLHDIGKIHVPEGILNKPGKFTPQEFEIMKSHPEEGKKILSYLPPINGGEFNKIAENMCLYHHEKWDGTGYPMGLSRDEIPLEARIMAAADVLDALLSRRLYKEPMSLEQAISIFKSLSGVQFEPCICDAIIARQDEIASCDEYFKQEEEKNNVTELEWWKRYHEYMESQGK